MGRATETTAARIKCAIESDTFVLLVFGSGLSLAEQRGRPEVNLSHFIPRIDLLLKQSTPHLTSSQSVAEHERVTVDFRSCQEFLAYEINKPFLFKSLLIWILQWNQRGCFSWMI